MIKVTDDTYENFIKKGNKIKILKLGATWCSPCQMAIPPCNELEKELENDIEIGELDIEEFQQYSSHACLQRCAIIC